MRARCMDIPYDLRRESNQLESTLIVNAQPIRPIRRAMGTVAVRARSPDRSDAHNVVSHASSVRSSRHAGFRPVATVGGSHNFNAASFILTVISAYRFVVSRLTCPS